MLAPPLDSIRAEVVERFRVVLAQDEAASTFPDLLKRCPEIGGEREGGTS